MMEIRKFQDPFDSKYRHCSALRQTV